MRSNFCLASRMIYVSDFFVGSPYLAIHMYCVDCLDIKLIGFTSSHPENFVVKAGCKQYRLTSCILYILHIKLFNSNWFYLATLLINFTHFVLRYSALVFLFVSILNSKFTANSANLPNYNFICNIWVIHANAKPNICVVHMMFVHSNFEYDCFVSLPLARWRGEYVCYTNQNQNDFH